MSIINFAVSNILRARIKIIEAFKKNSIDCQWEIFESLIETAENTEIGKLYSFSKIKSYEDYKKLVPIHDYEALKPYIERTMRGEQNLLWPESIYSFAKSSGTTSDKSKFIPLSESSLDACHYKAGTDMLAMYCSYFDDAEIFSGKSLTLGGSLKVSEFNKEARYGDLSALLMQNLPSWAMFFRTPSLKVALMEKWEEKMVAIANECIPQDVTNIVGVPSWTLVLFKKILEITGKKNMLEVWPNLEVFFHGGVSFKPYKEQFERLIPSDKMIYMETYNASEGFLGIEDIPGSGELLLMLDYGIFYEFIPLAELHKENPTVLHLGEVQVDEVYALLISTNAGLWRYLIGDTVRFTSTNPYRIKISGRTKHFINAFGEELMIENAESALAKACDLTGAVINDYTAGPVFMGQGNTGGHEWLIEFEKEPVDLSQFIKSLDEHLKSVNSDYEAKRYNDFVLQVPIVHKMEKGTFYNWLKSKDKLGGQNKVPRLANDRKFLDEIISMTSLNV
ncbi:MAG: GH3 auxin-responsive promoter family protein [Bacteroidetes bacterium]|nr:GH3 auxin-responsive promoter family protein [Bacteroidota bacterium]